MGTKFIALSVLLLWGSAHCQQSHINEGCAAYAMVGKPKPLYLHPNTIEASATFAPSVMLDRSELNYYLHAYAEYHLGKFYTNGSLRSDNYFFLNSNNENPMIHQGFRSYFGGIFKFRLSYPHPSKGSFAKNIRPYVGFQPGIAVMRLNRYNDQGALLDLAQTSVRPSFSVTAGVTIYFWDYFNFFARTSYLNTMVSGLDSGSIKANELVISTGLGFHLGLKRSKAK